MDIPQHIRERIKAAEALQLRLSNWQDLHPHVAMLAHLVIDDYNLDDSTILDTLNRWIPENKENWIKRERASDDPYDEAMARKEVAALETFLFELLEIPEDNRDILNDEYEL